MYSYLNIVDVHKNRATAATSAGAGSGFAITTDLAVVLQEIVGANVDNTTAATAGAGYCTTGTTGASSRYRLHRLTIGRAGIWIAGTPPTSTTMTSALNINTKW
ncbi:hypothetical protein DPMN_117911 [Dreissena polymorpha]|uniref:Uncharacterized protein n=1 Tax=Dreissena polymorpha TaxID=45954 RepID=A0A9D4JLE2_DREPO|nr:hypothetical protein DPMN_117911 [Dreissena polymorpha]